jgi:hypothetical protein
MNTYPTEVNTKLAEVYYNRGNPNLFMINHINVTLSDLKGQLDQINSRLNHRVQD